MIIDPVTSRWTDALFALAQDKDVLDEVTRDVERIAVEVGTPEVANFLFDARVPAGEKQKRVKELTSGFHTLTANFVGLLFDKNRSDVLRGLGHAFKLKVLASRGAVEGRVESARPLGSGELAELAVSLGSKLGKEVLLENVVVPTLVGGVRVTVGGRMIDYSVQGRLAGMRRKLMNARLPASAPA